MTWRMLGRFALATLLVMSFGLATACGDVSESRQKCQDACEKMKECDKPENGGKGELNGDWLDDCQFVCLDAEVVNGISAQCLIDNECAKIDEACKPQ